VAPPQRNGLRPKVISTKAGDLCLGIPKLRKDSFFLSILEPLRRIDQALYAVMTRAYVHGASTRAVDKLVQALGIFRDFSKSEASRACARFDQCAAAVRERRLDHTSFNSARLDAINRHVRDDHHVVPKGRRDPHARARRRHAGGARPLAAVFPPMRRRAPGAL
jgi:putative transposase